MDRFELTSKDIKEGMLTVTESSVYLWAYLYWNESLKQDEQKLKNAQDKQEIEFYRYHVVEAKKVIVELYEKLIKMPEFSDGLINKPDWVDAFVI